MVRRSNRNNRKRKSLIAVATSDRDTNKEILKQLIVGQGNSVPLVPDVPRMQVRRNKVITLSRNVGKGMITSLSNLPVLGSLQFQLSDLSSSGEFTSLFDQYKFQQVVVRFVPVSGQSDNNAYHLMPLMTVIDYDDANLPSSLDLLRQYSTLSVVPSGTITHVRTLTPRLSTEVYGSAIGSSFGVTRVWVDSASPSVPWYGVKYGIDANGTGNNICFQIECEYIISFRNTI